MKKLDELQRMKFLEIITIVVSLVGIILTLLHGNLYDYVFDLFSIKGIITFRLLYVSLFVYSTLAFVVFLSLFLFNEKNKEIRFYNYIQGWLFIIMAAASYEWFGNLIIFGSQIALSKQIAEDPYTFIAKRASVILFGALFIFWILEKKKNHSK
jgi:glucan phosphoethanolaminetransferase (alkaline phosphatase superfamily)